MCVLLLLVLQLPALMKPEVRALLVCVLPLLLVLQLPAQLEPEVRALLMPVLLLRVPQLPAALLYQISALKKGRSHLRLPP